MRKGPPRSNRPKIKVEADGTIARPSTQRLKSEKSPPPKDDFDEEAENDVRSYVGNLEDQRQWRASKQARDKIKAENARRKKRGEEPLPLPTVASRKKRRRERESSIKRSKKADTWYSDSEDETPLDFDPLPVLAAEPHEIFTVDTVIYGSMCKQQMKDRAPVETSVDLKPKVELSTPKETTLHTMPPVDVKPQLPADIKPRDMKKEATPTADNEDEGEEDGYEDDEVLVPSSLPSDVKPKVEILEDVKPTAADLERAERQLVEREAGEEEGEEEEYDDDDFVMAPRTAVNVATFGTAKPDVDPRTDVKQEVKMESEEDLKVKVEVKAEVKPGIDEYEEEEYEEEDWASVSDGSPMEDHELQSLLRPFARGNLAEGDVERPSFEYSAEQAAIGPFQLDPEDPSMVIPRSINRFLRDYQRVGAAFLFRKYKQGHGGVLGDDMGLGKTIQVISFLSAIMRKTGTSADYRRRKNAIRFGGHEISPQQWPTALIVCPKSLIFNWARELETWGYFEYAIWTSSTSREVSKKMRQGYLDIILVSHALVGQLSGLPFSTVIVDEAHKMKRRDSRLALAAKSIRARACFALTGTLVQNRIEELWSVLDFAWRGWAGTFEQWKTYAVNPINHGHKFDGTLEQMVNAVKRVGELSQKILPHFYLRRDKRLIAHEMPVKRDTPLLCPLGSRQAQVYQKVADSSEVQYLINHKARDGPFDSMLGDSPKVAQLRLFHAFVRISNHLALLYQGDDDSDEARETSARFFQFCTGDIYDPDKDKSGEAIYDPANCGKWTVLVNLLEEWHSKPEDKNKVLIFSTSVRLLKMIAKFIDVYLPGYTYGLFSGELDQDARTELVDRFQDPNKGLFIMLVSTLAGGVGLNLTAANKVVIFDPSWNPANDMQAMDRAFRIGQKRPVDVYRLFGKGTVEELMYSRQIYKQQRARQLNDGTFERRTHKGVDGSSIEQGDLFGLKNIFRYRPEGFIAQDLERVRLVEDQVRAELLAAQYEDDSDDDEDDEGKDLRRQRRNKEAKRQMLQAKNDSALLNELASDGNQSETAEERLMRELGITALQHDKAFKDSPEERKIFEVGLQILALNPEIARSIKANDAMKHRPKPAKRSKLEAKPEPDLEEDPWKKRLEKREREKQIQGRRERGRQLVMDADDEDD